MKGLVLPESPIFPRIAKGHAIQKPIFDATRRWQVFYHGKALSRRKLLTPSWRTWFFLR